MGPVCLLGSSAGAEGTMPELLSNSLMQRRLSRYHSPGGDEITCARAAAIYTKVAVRSLRRDQSLDGDRLGEVARLVDVGAHHHDGMIGDELHRDGVD